MDKDFLIQLTNNLYRLTLFFPKKEPLRYKMRERADEILAKPNEKDLEILDKFFEVAKNQNWVSLSDTLAIQKEYDSLRGELRKEKKANSLFEVRPQTIEVRPQTMEVRPRTLEVRPRVIPERQEKILAFLRENDRVQVGEVKQFFPEVTKRTLRRDFEHMLNQGIIERIGERNDTFYQIKIS